MTLESFGWDNFSFNDHRCMCNEGVDAKNECLNDDSFTALYMLKTKCVYWGVNTL